MNRREQLIDEIAHRMNQRIIGRLHSQRRHIESLEPVIRRIAPHSHLRRRAVELRDMEHRLRWAVCRRADCSERIERASVVIVGGMRHRMAIYREWIRRSADRLSAMSYKSVLGRGFSITRTKKGGNVVRSVRDVKDHQRLVTELADGEVESEVVNLKQLELFD